MATITGIEVLTRRYSGQRDELSQKVRALEERMNHAKTQALPAIKVALRKVKETEERLKAAIGESPELFDRPRAIIFYGIKVGFRKAKGTISWDDPDMVIKLIRKHFPDQAEILIRISEAPNKKALEEMPVGDLKRIGVTVDETGDEPFIKPVDSEVDRIVDTLLKKDVEREVA